MSTGVRQMTKPLICPLCTEGEMELKELPNEKSPGRENKTYIWICDTCPGVLLEWWDNTDTEAFTNHMKRDETREG